LRMIGLIVLCMLMFIYTILFSVRQSCPRQYAWFQSFLIYWIMEICFNDLLKTYWIHIYIPLLADRSIQRYKTKVITLLTDANMERIEQPMNDLTSTLFISKRFFSLLSNNNGTLYWNQIQAYHSFYPRNYLNFTSFWKNCIGQLMKYSIVTQDIIVSLMANCLIGGLCLLHLHLGRIGVGYAFIPVGVWIISLIILFIYERLMNRNDQNNIGIDESVTKQQVVQQVVQVQVNPKPDENDVNDNEQRPMEVVEYE